MIIMAMIPVSLCHDSDYDDGDEDDDSMEKSPADRGPASSDGLLHHRHCDKCKDQRNMIKRQECNEMNHPQS